MERLSDAILDTRARSGPEIEYVTLREEVLKLLEQRGTLLSITVTLAAAFLGLGWGTGGAVAILLYPPIAALVAAIWAQGEIRIRHIQGYIRDVLETRIAGLGWEHYSRQQASRGMPLDIMAIGGVFLLTQCLAILLGIFRFNPSDPVQIILFIIDFVAIAALFLLINAVRRAGQR